MAAPLDIRARTGAGRGIVAAAPSIVAPSVIGAVSASPEASEPEVEPLRDEGRPANILVRVSWSGAGNGAVPEAAWEEASSSEELVPTRIRCPEESAERSGAASGGSGAMVSEPSCECPEGNAARLADEEPGQGPRRR